jgi:hypothetical protein
VPKIQTLRSRIRSGAGQALVGLLAALLVSPGSAGALTQEPAATPTPTAEAIPEVAPKLSMDQLKSLVAPIALYPDPLLAQCLAASTYPLDLVEAQQWLTTNSSLKGDALEQAAQKQDWDPSVQAMVVIPEALKRMTEDIKWTTDLGNAFLAQQKEVMEAVQVLRNEAKNSGKLESGEQMKVETKVIESKTIVEIQPASTEVVYVPSYSPTVIWGAPMYPYPPMYYPPYYPGAALFSFGVGMMWGAAISGGAGWGCGWGDNDITINNNNNFNRNSNRTNNINRSGNSSWQHNAKNRGGAPYKDRATASKYGGGTRGDSATARQSQAQSRQSDSLQRGSNSASSDRSGAGASSRSSSDFGSSRSGGGGDRVGDRSVSQSSRSGGSAFSGSSGSRSSASSARGSSSMGSRGGGMHRGGGGGGRRR